MMRYDVTAHLPCREKDGFFLPSLAVACHNDLWLVISSSRQSYIKEIHGT
jgi:hypothetical protein